MTAIIILSIFIGAYALVILLDQRKRRKIYEARKHESICTFVRSFDYRAIDLGIVRATTGAFELWWLSGKDKIPYRKSDKVEDFGCCGGDFEDAVVEICQKTRRSTAFEGNPMLGRVITIEDVISLVNLQPKTCTTHQS